MCAHVEKSLIIWHVSDITGPATPHCVPLNPTRFGVILGIADPSRKVPQMSLSEIAVKNAKPQATLYKLFDYNGLFLAVTPSGSRLWRFKYRFAGKEQQLSPGR